MGEEKPGACSPVSWEHYSTQESHMAYDKLLS